MKADIGKWEDETQMRIEQWKSEVRARLVKIAKNVTNLNKLEEAAKKMRGEHKNAIGEHRRKIAAVNAQIAHLRALVAGIDIADLELDPSSPDVEKLVNASKAQDKFLEDKGLAPIRKAIDTFNGETAAIANIESKYASRNSGNALIEVASRRLLRGRREDGPMSEDLEDAFEDLEEGVTGLYDEEGEEEDDDDLHFDLSDDDIDLEEIWKALRSNAETEDGDVDDIAYASDQVTSAHSASAKFHRHAVNLRVRAVAMRQEAQRLDRKYEEARQRADDSVKYAQSLREILRERLDLVLHYKSALSIGDKLNKKEIPKLKSELEKATASKNNVFLKTQEAVAQAETDQERVKKVHDERFEAWRATHALARNAKTAAHMSIELQESASKKVLAYAEAMAKYQADKIETDREALMDMARDDVPVLGTLSTASIEELGFGSTGGESDLSYDTDLDDLPAPIGLWTPEIVDVEDTFASESFAATASASDADVAHIVAMAVPMLKSAGQREASIRAAIFSQSAEIHDKKSALDDKSKSITSDVSDSEKVALGRSGLELDVLRKEHERAQKSYEAQRLVVSALQRLVSKKLHLATEIHRLSLAKEAASKALDLLRSVRAKGSEAMLSASNAAMKEEMDAEEAETARKNRDYEATLLKNAVMPVGLQDFTSFLELNESQSQLLRALFALSRSARRDSVEDESESDDFENEDLLEDSATGSMEDENIRALVDGRIDDLVIPDWHAISSDATRTVAAAGLARAKAFEKHVRASVEKSEKNAKAAEKDRDATYDKMKEAEDRHNDAAKLALDAAITHSNAPHGGATGMAWRSMGLEGDIPDHWQSGDGSIEDGDATGPDAGPFGDDADILRGRIGQMSEVLELYRDESESAQERASELENEASSAKEDYEDSRRKAYESAYDHMQAKVVHDRMRKWSAYQQSVAKNAREWHDLNVEAEKERAQQEQVNALAAKIDAEN